MEHFALILLISHEIHAMSDTTDAYLYLRYNSVTVGHPRYGDLTSSKDGDQSGKPFLRCADFTFDIVCPFDECTTIGTNAKREARLFP